mgnify:CR=1 FL=1
MDRETVLSLFLTHLMDEQDITQMMLSFDHLKDIANRHSARNEGIKVELKGDDYILVQICKEGE